MEEVVAAVTAVGVDVEVELELDLFFFLPFRPKRLELGIDFGDSDRVECDGSGSDALRRISRRDPSAEEVSKAGEGRNVGKRIMFMVLCRDSQGEDENGRIVVAGVSLCGISHLRDDRPDGLGCIRLKTQVAVEGRIPRVSTRK
ncbi:hypothetical protein HRR83_002976 [Exophiala dermatitidis]|uniref:Uncharacterized protein n=1 Tax=Exophiala dermatitidis TaxID=5970 RepID=A0AAN6EMA0_EXODE|nr:hypothetical protein HRR73_008016 [Exophiala dermatitidis]KAJ4520593.1 hypothetical protein HRR74_003591 [Exophiala dermatitidis]KAJ4537768.1 hypothetical protein HRR76_005754 [Exophiala dermatitidis]KAJ4551568.1 hypothetical protein HRR77_002804 [Exophiala dermatitidis]KAJ4569301.1 hypothetical protein HRR79_004158 [Exophiala dermatitidis]